MTRVLVLGGGPDAERDISITSAKGVHRGCLDAGLDATLLIVDEPDLDEIRSWETEVVFPVLHGQFGEGGTLQHRLAQAGLPFVGTGFAGSALAMDKLGTKLIASGLGIPTPQPACCAMAPCAPHSSPPSSPSPCTTDRAWVCTYANPRATGRSQFAPSAPTCVTTRNGSI